MGSVARVRLRLTLVAMFVVAGEPHHDPLWITDLDLRNDVDGSLTPQPDRRSPAM